MKPDHFREVLKDLSWDMERYCHRIGAGRAQVLLLSPGFQALVVYRLGHWLLPVTRKKSGWNGLIALFIAFLRRFTEITTGIAIDPHATIGAGLVMLHSGDIVIGPTQIGRNCEIFQGVTLGVRDSLSTDVPTLGDRVYLAPGAKAMGNITLGDDVCVGPNSVVLNSVPDRSVVIGVPGRVVARTGSFDLVIYPRMEFDPDRQASLGMKEEALLAQNGNLHQAADLAGAS